jgi:hypothetical protein
MKETLKLALEALESIQAVYPCETAGQRITAIKAALAQQDGQSNFCAQCEAFARELRAVKQALAAQPAQEPVSWALQEEDGQVYDCICNEEHDRHEGRYTVPLYTTPQQRPWVGLTEDEMDNVRRSMGYNQFMSAGEYAKLVQIATQTKLKEKNT